VEFERAVALAHVAVDDLDGDAGVQLLGAVGPVVPEGDAHAPALVTEREVRHAPLAAVVAVEGPDGVRREDRSEQVHVRLPDRERVDTGVVTDIHVDGRLGVPLDAVGAHLQTVVPLLRAAAHPQHLPGFELLFGGGRVLVPERDADLSRLVGDLDVTHLAVLALVTLERTDIVD